MGAYPRLLLQNQGRSRLSNGHRSHGEVRGNRRRVGGRDRHHLPLLSNVPHHRRSVLPRPPLRRGLLQKEGRVKWLWDDGPNVDIEMLDLCYGMR